METKQDDRANLVDTVTEGFQLLDPTARLLVWIITRADSAHARGLVARVALRAIVEIRVRSTWTVPAGHQRSRTVSLSNARTHKCSPSWRYADTDGACT